MNQRCLCQAEAVVAMSAMKKKAPQASVNTNNIDSSSALRHHQLRLATELCFCACV